VGAIAPTVFEENLIDTFDILGLAPMGHKERKI